jgi:tRNA pseudouridine(38-40) synthase
VALITGYNGIDFSGSQKNKDVRTVEGQIEDALQKLHLIHDYNFGDLQKIGFNRATRTDKRVHALQNVFSCKIQFDDRGKSFEDSYEKLRSSLNATITNEVRIFAVVPVANRFCSKITTSHREYSYFLPSFCLTPIKDLILETPPKELAVDESAAEVVTQLTGGVKKILRRATNDDKIDDGEMFLERDISHISADMQKAMYATRMSDAQKEKLLKEWRSFEGTHKYHNYTKEVKAHQMAAQRFMHVMEINYMYVNTKTLEVTDAADPLALEFVHFYL